MGKPQVRRPSFEIVWRKYLAAIGRGRVRSDKTGRRRSNADRDLSTCFGFYREVRIEPQASQPPMRHLRPHDAWVDDPVDARYDSLFTLPCSAQAERMWRNDRIYDVLIVIGYNMNPVIQVRAAPYFYTQPARILLLPRAVSRSAGTSCPI